MTSYLNPQHHPLAFASLIAFPVILVAMILNSTFVPSLASLSLFPPYSGSPPVVSNSRTGISYRGTSVNGVEHFQNIFYAQDTAGSNRFAPPVAFNPPRGTVVDATAAGAWCPQGTGGPPLPFTSPIDNISENCLSLRIARPSGALGSAKLPVLVWLHGGGDALGSASDQLYQPDGLIKQAQSNNQRVIYVGVNYRLGIFGFATSEALRSVKNTNVGLRDQRAAFECERLNYIDDQAELTSYKNLGVRDNITPFGGDPGNIIAIGQSVGASAIGLHLVSYDGKQGVPFQKAIMMSGATGTNFNIMSSMVADNTAKVAKSVGCTSNPDSQETVDCLRNVPFKKLTDASVGLARQARPPFGELFFSPSYDGDYITDRPSVLLRKGAFVKNIPLIASWVANDGAWYAQSTITSDPSVLASFQQYIVGLSQPSLNRLLSLYPESDFTYLVRPGEKATSQYYRAAQLNRDIWFTCPVIDFTYHYSLSSSQDVRLYEMNQTKFGPIYAYMGVPEWRVAHLSDIPYVMNENVAAGGDNSPAQQELSAQLSGSIAAFAWTGNPTAKSAAKGAKALKDWPVAFGKGEQGPSKLNVFVIGGEQGSGAATARIGGGPGGGSQRDKAVAWEKLIERCAFINSITEEIGV